MAMAKAKMMVVLLLLLVFSANARLAANLEPWPNPPAMKSSMGHGHAPPSSSECDHKCEENLTYCETNCIRRTDDVVCEKECHDALVACKKACS